MGKLDFKKRDKPFYTGKQGRWDLIAVPPMQFVMIDGQGDPGGRDYARAVAALYPLAYGTKAIFKREGHDFVVPPLEALWWSDDLDAFVNDIRTEWQWTAMIRLPDEVDARTVEQARAHALVNLSRKKDKPTDAETMGRVRLEVLEEGEALQTLHIGPYSDEAPVLAHLHDELMPEMGVTFAGPHHEIYLGDPRKVAPEKLRTLLRQPVRAKA